MSRDLAAAFNGDGGRLTQLQDRGRGGRAAIARRGQESDPPQNNDLQSYDY